MPATDVFGIDRATLEASGALHTAREIAQQPRMLEATHALVAAMKAQLDAFCAPITHNPCLLYTSRCV